MADFNSLAVAKFLWSTSLTYQFLSWDKTYSGASTDSKVYPFPGANGSVTKNDAYPGNSFDPSLSEQVITGPTCLK